MREPQGNHTSTAYLPEDLMHVYLKVPILHNYRCDKRAHQRQRDPTDSRGKLIFQAGGTFLFKHPLHFLLRCLRFCFLLRLAGIPPLELLGIRGSTSVQ